VAAIQASAQSIRATACLGGDRLASLADNLPSDCEQKLSRIRQRIAAWQARRDLGAAYEF
jgi:hypothetical protein